MTNVVLDASALLAVSHSEPGAEVVRASRLGALISAVNYSEVLKKSIERGVPVGPLIALVRGASVSIVPFDEALAVVSAELYPETKRYGLSFADRTCLALGVQRNCKVLTAERQMGKASLPIKSNSSATTMAGTDVIAVEPLTPQEFGALADVPPELEWLANIANEKIRRACKNDVAEFSRFTGLREPGQLRTLARVHVIAWRKHLETRELSPASIRRKLSALSSLFDYLCERNAVLGDPVDGVNRPTANGNEGSTLPWETRRREGCWRPSHSYRFEIVMMVEYVRDAGKHRVMTG